MALPFPADTRFRQIEAHFTQSLALLEDGQILQWGWTLDQLTSTRTLAYYKKAPAFFIALQKYLPFDTWGMRTYLSSPSLINAKLMETTRIDHVQFGNAL